jgi:GxxExxY protein
MEVHKILGKGYSEIIYGDALEYEFRKNGIAFEREKNQHHLQRYCITASLLFRLCSF